jgi:hypothetical protein
MYLPRLQRRPELDALRGLFLVWMTLTHLPTCLSDLVNSPLGFVSSAEGFVFVSALLVGRLYIRDLLADASVVRVRLWKRSLQIYGYHLLMLALVFTVAAGVAIHTHKAAISNLLDFYLAHPLVAVVGSVLLIYCPPLLDILPMYVTFLFFSPIVLSSSVRFGWRKILIASGCVWILAQFGLRLYFHHWIVSLTHLNIPLQQTGSFNLFAWQAVWTAGLWLGARSAMHETTFRRMPGWLTAISSIALVFFIGVRWNWWGPHLAQHSFGLLLDKWQIGSLRMLNLISFSVVAYWLRDRLVPLFSIEPFLTLGKASLRVFCAHVVFVFVGLAFLMRDVGHDNDTIEQLSGWPAAVLVGVTLLVLFLVAAFKERQRHARSGQPGIPQTADGSGSPVVVSEPEAYVEAASAGPS